MGSAGGEEGEEGVEETSLLSSHGSMILGMGGFSTWPLEMRVVLVWPSSSRGVGGSRLPLRDFIEDSSKRSDALTGQSRRRMFGFSTVGPSKRT